MSLFPWKKKPSQPEEEQIPITNEVQMLFARLLFETEPVLDDTLMEAHLSRQFSKFESPQRGDKISRLYFFSDYTFQFNEATMHAQCTLFKTGQDAIAKNLETGYRQKWHWPNADQETANCKYELVLSDLLTRTMDYKLRLEVFQKYIYSLVTALKPVAIYFPTSEKLVKTSEYLEELNKEGYLALYGFLNVRLFNAGNNQMVMDTAGLHAFGLPDFQFIFTGHDPSRVAGLLTTYAQYIFDNGSVILNGNTIQGIDDGSRWKCHYADAIAEPKRFVLNIEE